jgi:hypothetical protein
MTAEAADDIDICQELLQVTNTLDKGQTAAIYFLTWAKRASVIKTMETRYREADLRRIEFGLYH